MRRCLPLLLVLFAAMARAQEPEPVTTVIVPVVGRILGANAVQWHTDVEIVNDLGREAVVALELPTTEAGPIILTMAPGETQRFPNIIGEAFGLESSLSPLLITTSARRSVTVRAMAYAVANGTVSSPQPISLNHGPNFYPLRLLDGLSFSEQLRTNIGLVNLGETDAQFVLALQRVADRNLAVSRVIVPKNAMWHMSIQTLFPMITKGDDFAILIETPNPGTYVYASVVDNQTNAARFIQPRLGAQ
jgi:hypothetical protein